MAGTEISSSRTFILDDRLNMHVDAVGTCSRFQTHMLFPLSPDSTSFLL
jgi:hypothetical protein